MTSTTLYYNDLAVGGSSDKVYQIQIVKNGSGYLVNFQYGRRGGTLQSDTKTKKAVPKEEAEKIYIKTVREKLAKGYVGGEAGSAPTAAPTVLPSNVGHSRYPVENPVEITRAEAEAFIKDRRYFMQVKDDGHRRQTEKLPSGAIVGYNKKGGPTTIPKEVEAELAKLPFDTFFFDGELVGTKYIVWDVLELDGQKMGTLPYELRYDKVQEIFGDQMYIQATTTWFSTYDKQAGFAACLKQRREGVCFKLKEAPYKAGDSGQHKKFKFLKSCTCKVVGVGHKGHNSATLAVHNNGKWQEIGRASLNGKDSKIKVGTLVEITFLYFTGSRLYQPRIDRIRHDQDESNCTFKQLAAAYKEGVEV